jgi:hypothetical protein
MHSGESWMRIHSLIILGSKPRLNFHPPWNAEAEYLLYGAQSPGPRRGYDERRRNEAYARWYSEALKATEPAGLIFVEDRWVVPDDQIFTIGVLEDVKIRLPPSGRSGLPQLIPDSPFIRRNCGTNLSAHQSGMVT